MTDEALRIIQLEVSNVKRVKAVTIRPDGPTVLIGGENEQGKTSVIDSIEMALNGGRAIPIQPVRNGTRKARIVVDLGEIVVERTFNKTGSQLVVRGKDGHEISSPQKLLDSLCAKVAFDPFAFSRMEPKKQDELLKKLIGVDFSDLDRKHKHSYECRTEAAREVKRLEALLDEAPEYHSDAPKEPVKVEDFTTQIQRHIEATNTRNQALNRLDAMRISIASQDAVIVRLRAELKGSESARAEIERILAEKEAELPDEPAPIDEIRTHLKNAEATNAKVRENAARAKLEKDLAGKNGIVETCTETIATLAEERAERLSAAKFPVPGLGFDEAGPTLKGVPFEQASQAERLRASIAIGAAQRPRVKVMLIREGAFLGDNSLALLEELAKETGFQLWIERVSDKDQGAIIIDDGEVRGARVDDGVANDVGDDERADAPVQVPA